MPEPATHILEKLHVENFGCLKKVDIEFTPFTVLVGPNDSGKSMILKAIESLGMAVREGQGWASVFPTREAFTSTTFRGEGSAIRFDLEGAADTAKYTYKTRVGGGRPEVGIEYEEWRLGENVVFTRQEQTLTSSATPQPRAVPPTQLPVLNETLVDHLLGAQFRTHAHALAQALGGTKRFSLTPQRLREPNEHKLAPTLASDGFGLSRTYADLLLGYRKHADAIEKALREAMPLVTRAHIRESSHKYELEAETATGTRIPAHLMSDGILLFLAYLLLTMGPTAGPLLLLDEPETGVHPGLLARVVELLKDLTTGKFGARAQVIATTHSPLFLNFVDPSEIRVLQRSEAAGTSVTPFESTAELATLLEFQGPGEIWANLGEQSLFQPDAAAAK